MSVKKIYFVRHGQTDSNITKAWQDPEESLNETGIRQAALLAERIKNLKIDRVFVSSMPRALQTFEAISAVTSLPYEKSDLFREVKVPTPLIAAPHSDDPDSLQQQFRRERIAYANDPNWRFADEENASDFLSRIKAALEYLTTIPEENILVVTHGAFLRCSVGYVITGGNCTAEDMYRFTVASKITNTGISIFEHSLNGWVLNTWNDIAHFAE